MTSTTLLSILSIATLFLAARASADATTQPAERTTPSGLKITDTKTIGDALTAQNNDMVWVHYTGTLQNGTVFDSSIKRVNPQTGEADPIAFRLGQGHVIKGWDEGIAGMKVGEKRRLVIPPTLAYGNAGTPGGPIPPDATLTFEVELVGIYRDTK